MPTKSPERHQIVEALAQVLRRGLPLTPDSVDPVLLELRGVVARAADPTDCDSCTAALDGALRAALARFPDARYVLAVRALFGLPPARQGLNISRRREVAANAAGRELHHFRKRIEPRLVEQLAWMLLADAERFTHTPFVAPRLTPARDRQAVPADPFAWEVTEQEEALARVWSAVFALRAELLAAERLVSLQVESREVDAQAITAAWQWAKASLAARAYATEFGRGMPSSPDPEPDGEQLGGDKLVALAGWIPPLRLTECELLRDAAAATSSRAEFVAALHDRDELDLWVAAFRTLRQPLAHAAEPRWEKP